MKFIGRQPLVTPVSADELADIDLSGLVSGDLLQFDGTNFVVLTPGSGSGLDADTVDGSEASDFASAAQGSLADTAVQPNDDASVLGAASGNEDTFLGAVGGDAVWRSLPNVEELGHGGASEGTVLTAGPGGATTFEEPGLNDKVSPFLLMGA